MLQKLKPILMATSKDSLLVQRAQSGAAWGGGFDLFLDQDIAGIPVIDGGVNVRLSKAGEVIAVSSRFVPGDGVRSEPKLDLASANKKVEEFLVSSEMAQAPSINLNPPGSLAFWTDQGKAERPLLVWLIRASYRRSDGTPDSVTLGVDAETGDIRYATRESFGLNRTVYSLNGHYDYQAKIEAGQIQLLWTEGSPYQPDPFGRAAYDLIPRARNVCASVGMNYDTLGIVVNWGSVNNSAYTQGTQSGFPYLVFTDSMAGDQDAVAHEYGHGVFRRTAGPAPRIKLWDEYFAASEAFADLSSVTAALNETGGSPETYRITLMNLRDWGWPTSPNVYQRLGSSPTG